MAGVEIPLDLKRRRRRYDHHEITWYMHALIGHPEIITALGGIPDKLKIKDCISLGCSNHIKVPKDLPQGPTEYYKALRMVIKKILLEKYGDQASEKTLEDSSICKQLPIVYTDELRPLRYLLDSINEQLMEDEQGEEDPHNMIQQQLNVAAILGIHVPMEEMKQAVAMAQRRGVKTYLLSVETPLGINHIFKCDGGDDDPYQSIHYIKGVICNQPEIVAAVGGIPDELKIKDGVSFWVPNPSFKVPKDMHPSEYYKQLEEEPHNTIHQQLPPTMLEVNVAKLPCNMFFKELNKEKVET